MYTIRTVGIPEVLEEFDEVVFLDSPAESHGRLDTSAGRNSGYDGNVGMVEVLLINSLIDVFDLVVQTRHGVLSEDDLIDVDYLLLGGPCGLKCS